MRARSFDMISPEAFVRRSPVRRALTSAGAEWRAAGAAAIVARVPGGREAIARLALIDLSPLDRTGFKGAGTMAAMRDAGVLAEPVPNRAFRQPDGGLCLVLAPNEVFLLPPLFAEPATVERVSRSWTIEGANRAYLLPRADSHAWFLLTGEHVVDMLAKICAIDFRRHAFANHDIAQTSLAKLSAIVVRDDQGALPAYHLLADSASALYLLQSLTDAAAEFDGRLAGVDDLESHPLHERQTGPEG
jgi:sarcosine oxidase, subunit gamma